MADELSARWQRVVELWGLEISYEIVAYCH